MGSETTNMCEKNVVAESGGDAKDEIKALLLTSRGGVGVRSDDDGRKSVMRKVQWNDEKGYKLVEVVEFEPSEASDSDSEDSFDSCICSVM